MKPGFLLVVTALIALPVAAQTPSPDRLQKVLESGVLRVGTTMDAPVLVPLFGDE